MAVFLDHLTAVAAGSVLLLALVGLQLRGQERSIEAASRYRGQTHAAEFLRTVERDVENALTAAQTADVFGAFQLTVRRDTGATGETYTGEFAVPTRVVPADGGPPEVALVRYLAAPTGRTVWVDGEARPTVRVERWAVGADGTARLAGGSGDLVEFDVTAIDGGAEVAHRLSFPDVPPRVHVSVVAAGSDVPVRYARAVRVRNFGATGTPATGTTASSYSGSARYGPSSGGP